MKSHYIQNQLIQHGRAASTPIAIIERGTQIQQKVFTGELSQLSDLSKEAQAPSLIVVGEVVRLSQKLDWFLSSTDFNKSAIANSI